MTKKVNLFISNEEEEFDLKREYYLHSDYVEDLNCEYKIVLIMPEANRSTKVLLMFLEGFVECLNNKVLNVVTYSDIVLNYLQYLMARGDIDLSVIYLNGHGIRTKIAVEEFGFIAENKYIDKFEGDRLEVARMFAKEYRNKTHYHPNAV